MMISLRGVMLILGDADELRRMLSLIHKIMAEKQELHGEDEVDSTCLLQVRNKTLNTVSINLSLKHVN